MIRGCLPLFSQTQNLLHEETNLFTNSKDLNDMKTIFTIKRIHDSYLGLKILGKHWLHLLNYIHQINFSQYFQASFTELAKNGSFLLLIVKLLYIYVRSRPSRLSHGSTGFHQSFYLTRTGSATGLTGSQVNPPGRFEFNNTGLHTKSHEKSSIC